MNARLTSVRHLLTSASLGRQTLLLFLIDSVTNVIDYGFHIVMGRSLSPGDFAILQAINAAMLIVLTVCGVLQPVVARYVVEAREDGEKRGVFQAWFGYSAMLGAALSLLVWLGRSAVAAWWGVPTQVIAPLSVVLLLALLRPVLGGLLQGTERFLAFGMTRALYAISRFAAGVLLVWFGVGVMGAIGALPVGALVSVLGATALVGGSAWRRAPRPKRSSLVDGLRLSAGAFLAFGAYMLMMNGDMIWANRSFAPDLAGNYATAVLLRRVVSLLPGAAIVVMYPKAVAKVSRGQIPDRLLVETATIVAASGLALSALYFALGPRIVRLAFGSQYGVTGELLGWMGLAMIGYGMASIWMNFFLAIRPGPFVALLALTAGAQSLLLRWFHESPSQVVTVFALTGWALAAGGGLLYALWLRPKLAAASVDSGGVHVRTG